MRVEHGLAIAKPPAAPRPALPPLILKGKKLTVPIVQGGMGVGVSLHPLAGAVAREGGLGVVSSAAIDRVISKRLGRKIGTYEAVREEIAASKAQGGFAGINIIVALQRDFADSVRGAVDAGADAIISGAGLPTSLPAIQDPRDTNSADRAYLQRAPELARLQPRGRGAALHRWQQCLSRRERRVGEGPHGRAARHRAAGMGSRRGGPLRGPGLSVALSPAALAGGADPLE